MKPLKPSMRENKRYMLVKGKPEDIEKAILDFIGVLGMSKSGLQWIKKSKDSSIISVNRKAVNDVRASFAAWQNEISTKRISGTLKGLKKQGF